MCACFEVLGFDILLDDKLMVEDGRGRSLGFCKTKVCPEQDPGIGVVEHTVADAEAFVRGVVVVVSPLGGGFPAWWCLTLLQLHGL